MSRSNESAIIANPVKKYLKWEHEKVTTLDEDGEEVKKYKTSQFVYWDKELEKNVPIAFPFKFAVLEKDTFNYKGYSNNEKAYLYTNEVRKRWSGNGFKAEDLELELTVRNSKTKEVVVDPVKVKNLNNVKEIFDGHSLKKAESVYIAVKVDGEWEIWNLQLTKSQLSGGKGPNVPKGQKGGWWEFKTLASKGNQIYNNFIEVTKPEIVKSNMGKFGVPVFEIGEKLSKEDLAALEKLDKEVQDYLNYYFAKPKDAPVEEDDYPDFVTEGNDASWDDVND